VKSAAGYEILIADMNRFLLLCALNSSLTFAFSGGAPVCTVTPAELTASMSATTLVSPAGWSIVASTLVWTPHGVDLTLALQNTDTAKQFKGLLLWVENAQGTLLGTFTAPSGFMVCSSSSAAITHVSAALKSQQSFTWTSPHMQSVGNLFVKAAVVESYSAWAFVDPVVLSESGFDASVPMPDAGNLDAGVLVDGGANDSGTTDAGRVDAGATDGGSDAGTKDSGTPDAGHMHGAGGGNASGGGSGNTTGGGAAGGTHVHAGGGDHSHSGGGAAGGSMMQSMNCGCQEVQFNSLFLLGIPLVQLLRRKRQ
jgi:Reeler domain